MLLCAIAIGARLTQTPPDVKTATILGLQLGMTRHEVEQRVGKPTDAPSWGILEPTPTRKGKFAHYQLPNPYSDFPSIVNVYVWYRGERVVQVQGNGLELDGATVTDSYNRNHALERLRTPDALGFAGDPQDDFGVYWGLRYNKLNLSVVTYHKTLFISAILSKRDESRAAKSVKEREKLAEQWLYLEKSYPPVAK